MSALCRSSLRTVNCASFTATVESVHAQLLFCCVPLFKDSISVKTLSSTLSSALSLCPFLAFSAVVPLASAPYILILINVFSFGLCCLRFRALHVRLNSGETSISAGSAPATRSVFLQNLQASSSSSATAGSAPNVGSGNDNMISSNSEDTSGHSEHRPLVHTSGALREARKSFMSKISKMKKAEIQDIFRAMEVRLSLSKTRAELIDILRELNHDLPDPWVITVLPGNEHKVEHLSESLQREVPPVQTPPPFSARPRHPVTAARPPATTPTPRASEMVEETEETMPESDQEESEWTQVPPEGQPWRLDPALAAKLPAPGVFFATFLPADRRTQILERWPPVENLPSPPPTAAPGRDQRQKRQLDTSLIGVLRRCTEVLRPLLAAQQQLLDHEEGNADAVYATITTAIDDAVRLQVHLIGIVHHLRVCEVFGHSSTIAKVSGPSRARKAEFLPQPVLDDIAHETQARRVLQEAQRLDMSQRRPFQGARS